MTEFDTRPTSERNIIDFKKFDLNGQFRLGRYSYKNAHRGLDAHTHQGMMEICYYDKGLQIYEVGDRQYQIKGGDVFITFPNELHGTAYYPEEKGVLYWLIVEIPANGQFLNFSIGDSAIFLKELLNIPNRHFKGSSAMKNTLDKIFEIYNSDDPLNKLNTLNLLTTFLLTIIRYSGKVSTEPQQDRVIHIKNFIKAHIYHKLSIPFLAAEMFLSDSHFKSWFKKEFGIPPMDYILRERVDEAKKLLDENKELSITHISYKLNFSSSQYFATVFKKYTGLSPVEFKNKVL